MAGMFDDLPDLPKSGGFDPDAFINAHGAGRGFDPDAFIAQHGGGMFDDLPDQKMSWSDVPGQAASNFGQSAANFGKAMAQPFLHPFNTLGTLADLPAAFAQQAGLISGQEGVPQAQAVEKFFKDRYGGMENIKHTLATDPVGSLADASAVLTGGETALARVPGAIGKIGEVAGTVGRTIDPLNAVTKPITALTAAGSEQRALADAGTHMTPGQMVGGYFKSLEDAATSVPLLGSFIKAGRNRSIESFNKSVANQALEPIGESVARGTSAGHDMVDEVATKIGNEYDTLLPQMTFVPDTQYWTDLKNIYAGPVARMPDTTANQFDRILHSILGPPATMDGRMFKDAESELGAIASNHTSSPLASERDLGNALNGVVKAMRSGLERSNPNYGTELAAINSAYAMYARIRAAAARRATSEGVFTPNDLLNAIKSGDKSVGKGSFARGDALMQTFAEAGQKVLPSKLADSGTPERLGAMATLGGAGYLLGNPHIVAAGAAAASPYTRPGMWALNRAVSPVARFVSPYVKPAARAAYQVGRVSNNPYAPQ